MDDFTYGWDADAYSKNWREEYAFSLELQREREEYEDMLLQEYEAEEQYLRTHNITVSDY